MSSKPNADCGHRVLLIGIDRYPHLSPDKQLHGCVRDIERMETFLTTRLAVPDGCITKLVSSHASQDREDNLPTYDAIRQAMREIAAQATAGQQIFIHYSGHGARMPTKFPEIKTAHGFDEGLAPCDLYEPGVDLLRDVEFAVLLQKIIDMKAFITLVLDCCHSGGAVRGMSTATVRRLDLENAKLPFALSETERQRLIAEWHKTHPAGMSATRNLASGMSDLAGVNDYVLLAACRESESAYEDEFEDVGRCGALTYWFLNSMKLLTPNMTFNMLNDHIVARVHSRYVNQTPMLFGNGDRVVFGNAKRQLQQTATVVSVNLAKAILTLDAGQAAGIAVGAKLAVYSAGADSPANASRRVAVIQVVNAEADRAYAVPIGDAPQKDLACIEPGSPVEVIDPGVLKLRRSVRLVVQACSASNPGQAHPVSAHDQLVALMRVKETLNDESLRGWVELIDEPERPVEFQVVINDENQYEIWDAAGALIALHPPIQVIDESADESVARRLVHLTKYRNVQELRNYDGQSYLANRLQVEFLGWQQDYNRGDKPAPVPFEGEPKVKAGQTVFLQINNLLPRKKAVGGTPEPNVLNITVLDLQPDWGISQIFPNRIGRFIEVTPGVPCVLDLKAILPEGLNGGKDVIKVMATLTNKTTNFHWLELQPLDQPTRALQAVSRSEMSSPLEALMAAIATQSPANRQLESSASSSDDWTTAQIEIEIEIERD